jgi:hypothetical protein
MAHNKTRPLGPPIHTGRGIQTDAGHVKTNPVTTGGKTRMSHRPQSNRFKHEVQRVK